ncbi:uncharacterized protein (DUF885 family) [Sphingomonas vulcanisoli]|uniref:Uncharacterized protein (DUF885 family) n=1 Tax=Sphingomonas vulcanisoli TaxID=1658060 RepID=A0ABX0TT29_9SPHN|nr:DUF885 family protein [Sphingomonas vulcanisoli]NIJ07557.1 uncharacterized protein (DUF885 family) [Sphingomonas vulcanisoli]
MRAVNRREWMAGAAAIGVGAAFPLAAQAPAAPGDAAATNLLGQTAERLLTEYPENASYLGIDKGARAGLRARLTDRSINAERRRMAWADRRLAELKAVDRAHLSPGVALDMDVAQTAFGLAVDGWKFPYGDMAVLSGSNGFRNSPYVVSQLGGAFVDTPDFLDNKHPIATSIDAEAYLARVEAYAGQLAGETDRIGADAAHGVIPPDFICDMVLGNLSAGRAEPASEWGVVKTLRRLSKDAGLNDSYAAKAQALVVERVAPALDRQIAVLRAARAEATSAPGVDKLRDGADYYAWVLRAGTTTNATPDEVHTLGQQQIAAIQGEMDGLLKAQGLSKGTVGERMTALSKRPDLLFANNDAGRAKLLAYLNGRITDIRGRMPKAFATLVKGNLVIKRVPPSIQDGAPNGYAASGSIDGTMPGVYYINLKDTGIWPRYALPTLCYHEGIPGHVWQGEYANAMPLIRNYIAFNAYSEGWALYAEQLGFELGAYDGDPLGRLGYLQSMGFRACRMVVDTGIHAKGWSFDQALQWAIANTGMTRAQWVSELTRYCAMPGQACGYKMGHNEINRQRVRAQSALGAKFDLRRFDDAVVQGGNVPLNLLDPIVDRYIKSA